jgi:hypothetical protein
MSLKVLLHTSWNKLRLYLSFLLLVFYLIVGFLFLFSDIWANILPKGRGLVGTILVVYACFRFYISYRRYKRKHLKIQILKEQKKKNKEKQNVEIEKLP